MRRVGIIILILLTLSLSGFFAWRQWHSTNKKPVLQPPAKTQTSAATPNTVTPPAPESELVVPIAEFKQRITKKFFGTYVTPSNSPVQPERFQGYHAGVDVEYGDVSTDVSVHAITDGQIVYSQWVSGYGGVEIIRHTISGTSRLVLYGHLRPSSLLPVNTTVTKNQQIGVLGTAYSRETDNERRHLHFSILAGSDINLRGYATTRAGLSSWIDPLSLYPN